MAQEQDIVLIHFEDKPLAFARIEEISADYKPNWYHVKLLLLQIPLQVVTWILRDVYIDGQEFTMGGKRMRMEKVVCPQTPEPEPKKEQEQEESEKTAYKEKGKVISIAQMRKNPDDEPA